MYTGYVYLYEGSKRKQVIITELNIFEKKNNQNMNMVFEFRVIVSYKYISAFARENCIILYFYLPSWSLVMRAI